MSETTESKEPTTGDPNARLESGKEHARKAAEDLKAAAQAKADELRSAAAHKADEFRHRAEQAWSDASNRAQTLREDGEQYVRQRPIQSVLGAFAVGLVLGMLIRR